MAFSQLCNNPIDDQLVWSQAQWFEFSHTQLIKSHTQLVCLNPNYLCFVIM